MVTEASTVSNIFRVLMAISSTEHRAQKAALSPCQSLAALPSGKQQGNQVTRGKISVFQVCKGYVIYKQNQNESQNHMETAWFPLLFLTHQL